MEPSGSTRYPRGQVAGQRLQVSLSRMCHGLRWTAPLVALAHVRSAAHAQRMAVFPGDIWRACPGLEECTVDRRANKLRAWGFTSFDQLTLVEPSDFHGAAPRDDVARGGQRAPFRLAVAGRESAAGLAARAQRR